MPLDNESPVPDRTGSRCKMPHPLPVGPAVVKSFQYAMIELFSAVAGGQLFWYAGMVFGAIGLAVALAGFFMTASHDSSEGHEGHAQARPALVAARG